MTCEQARLSLGVYVLDVLDPEECADVEAHLSVCPACAAEAAELSALPGLLGSLTAEEIEGDAPAASPDGFERLLARARADEAARARRFRLRLQAGAAAAAVLLIALVLSLGPFGASPSPRHTYQASGGDVRMTVSLTDQVSGTALDVTVRGVRRGERCTLVALRRDGTRETVATWQVTYSGEAWSKVATSIPRSQLSRLQLLGAKGNTLVTLRV